ncbi:acyl-CoA thioesterase [Chitinophaga pendula]|uniref:acyl-CoA thioesterase n=1 Tax=Chitinophaga TaxID=79328 RepID=UPI0018DF2AC6|nr:MULTISPECIES: acyl-CoA thioesterase [Chitinophaga]UCJ10154.1 acyl-CoA thioesterase [Chitinophaga pendula]
MNIFYEGQVLWAQIDVNGHMRHSAYADYAAQGRLALLASVGLNPKTFLELKVGPVLFKEESVYLREVSLNETIKVSAELIRYRPNGSRWTIRNEIFRSDGVKAAVITVEGAWLDTERRKIITLPPDLNNLFMAVPKSEDFTIEEK